MTNSSRCGFKWSGTYGWGGAKTGDLETLDAQHRTQTGCDGCSPLSALCEDIDIDLSPSTSRLHGGSHAVFSAMGTVIASRASTGTFGDARNDQLQVMIRCLGTPMREWGC